MGLGDFAKKLGGAWFSGGLSETGSGAEGLPFIGAGISAGKNREHSAQQAHNQMNFQERMSNTAHQRQVADLKAAGLNPILSTNASGASSPSGAMGQGFMNTAGSEQSAKAVLSLMKKENELADSNIDKNNAQKQLADDQAQNQKAQARYTDVTAKKAAEETKIVKMRQAGAKVDEWYNQNLGKVGKTLSTAKQTGGVFSGIKKWWNNLGKMKIKRSKTFMAPKSHNGKPIAGKSKQFRNAQKRTQKARRNYYERD